MHASQTNSNILIDAMTLNTWHASFFLLSFLLLVPLQKSELQVGFYSASCPMAEFIIREEVNKAVFQDRGIAAGLVRLHFHDCFVRGCDASVLIDSTPSNIAEKDSPANNPSLRGFEVIDDAKSRLEAACPGVVSCADIIAFAARDSIQISGGLGYRVAGGRRDGRVSVIAETEALPPSTADLNQLTQMFSTHGLTQEEMVTLSGAHTIGRSHCTSFDSRLYSYSATAKQDPSLDAFYATQLRQQCPPQGGDAVVPMNPTSPTFMDAAYYMDVLTGRGLFTSDHSLLTATSTTNQVTRYAINPLLWKSDFAAAMVKMGQIGADQEGGEIRSNCRAINNN